MKTLWSMLLMLTFAAWWGGLTFYSVAVVPIGSEQIGTSQQGFITQQVTFQHNLLLVVMTGLLLIEAWQRRRLWLGVLVVALALVGAALFFQHAHLTNLMDFNSRTVPSTFYSQHAIYLWLTAAEWAIGIALAFHIVRTSFGGRLKKHEQSPEPHD